eukprot:280574_1
MQPLTFAKLNWKKLILGGVVATASITYFAYSHLHKTYPQFVSLPGPFKHIGISYHKIPNNTRFKLYYPTSLSNIKQSNSKPPKTYFTDIKSIQTLSKKFNIPLFILKALNDCENTNNPIPCFQNAPILNAKNDYKYPLLFFSHGNFAGFDMYTQLLCSLASYGIVVAILDHTDASALYTKTYDNKELYYKPRGNDIDDCGNERLKPIRVPEFVKLYEYLTKSHNTELEDKQLMDVLSSSDMNNLIFSGQSFGGVTCWMASHEIKDDDALKCMLLLDPWFGCVDINELKQIKWNIPTYVLSSESWMQKEPYLMKLKQIVINNNMNKKSVWECAKAFTHWDSADASIFAPSWLTKCRQIYTAQQWSDLLSKRCASFIADVIPEFKQQIQGKYLDYDSESLVSLRE